MRRLPQKENSKTHRFAGHYVRNECHTADMDTIIGLCLKNISQSGTYSRKSASARTARFSVRVNDCSLIRGVPFVHTPKQKQT